MNSQELRALQEAYISVYADLDEGYKELPSKRMADAVVKKTIKSLTTLNRAKRERTSQQGLNVLNTMGSHDPTAAKAKSKYKTEQVDLYDLILSHLLDEGYADTEQAAEAIMVNMSEEWRESIVEARMDPRGRPASGPMNVYANPKGKPDQAHLDAIKSYDEKQKKKTPEQRKAELDAYKERQLNNK